MEVIRGIPVAPGVCTGPAFVIDEARARVPRHTISEEQIDEQIDVLQAIWEKVLSEIEADRLRAEQELGREPAKIFEFHIGLLRDPGLMEAVESRVRSECVTIAYAVSEAFRELADKFRQMGDIVFRQKAEDIMDLDQRLLSHLMGRSMDRLEGLRTPAVVIAHELTPAQVARLNTEYVLAIIIDGGGRTSHSSIIASALGIPVVVGCRTISDVIDDGEEVIVDGNSGVVVVRPDENTLLQYSRSAERMQGRHRRVQEMLDEEAVTRDGEYIELMGNIEFADEIPQLIANGGRGVGLYRTEYLYMTRESPPNEEEHYTEYMRCLEFLDGLPLTIRTFDLGADKMARVPVEDPEQNPMLGLRSIRYCLHHIGMFREQLRAILRASANGQVSIMFPLISTPVELKQVRMILHDLCDEMKEKGIPFDPSIPIGMMVEVPSAALMASTFAKEVDFFSIGTNDLVQYTLAVDRGNSRVANLYSAANPAVLTLLKTIIKASTRHGVRTSICGEIAGETVYTMLLIGLGLRTLSLVPSQIPMIKQVVRSVDTEDCRRIVRKVGALDSEREILKYLRDKLEDTIPEIGDDWSDEL